MSRTEERIESVTFLREWAEELVSLCVNSIDAIRYAPEEVSGGVAAEVEPFLENAKEHFKGRHKSGARDEDDSEFCPFCALEASAVYAP